MTKTHLSRRTLSYAALIFVILVWSTVPVVTASLYERYTPTILTATTALISGISLLVISFPERRRFSLDYLKLAVPTGIFNSAASILQKIGLQYTTPARYAFLENLSCVVVPILLFLFLRKKPSVITVAASLLCLLGSFILSGVEIGGTVLGRGEVLCALAGLLYGVNIAATGAFGKKLYPPLYVMIQIWIHSALSFATAFVMNAIERDGAPLEAIRFSWRFGDLCAILALALISSTLCWIIRTSVMKHINASAVAILMPFSAVVTGIISVILGMDTLGLPLILGALISLAAAILSGFGDRREHRNEIKETTNE